LVTNEFCLNMSCGVLDRLTWFQMICYIRIKKIIKIFVKKNAKTIPLYL